MPKRTDLSTILLIGSGPIVIGQGAEFDYSGTQAVKALKEEGYRVVLVNSNPATIMTDPELADRTYIEPVTPEWVAKVIERERPDALLPTMGGQTGLNVAMALQRDGTLARYGVELIGANERAIRLAEDVPISPASVRDQGQVIEAVFPVIELHDYVLDNARATCPALVACNGMHAGLVLADEETPCPEPTHDVQYLSIQIGRASCRERVLLGV